LDGQNQPQQDQHLCLQKTIVILSLAQIQYAESL